MRLLEAIIDANHRALSGDSKAGIHPDEFRTELPLIGLTCIDPRLNRLFPGIMGLPDNEFIWLRNAGNIITGPLSSTMRSLALACAVKEGKEIVVIGHTDCRVRQTTVTTLVEQFKALGVERSRLPDNLAEFFGMFASENQNVINAVGTIRSSPIIGPKIPVHGLMVDIATGKLDWVVNGYETLDRAPTHPQNEAPISTLGSDLKELAGAIGSFNIGEMAFPEGKIGEIVADVKERIAAAENVVESAKRVLHKPSAPEPPPPPLIQNKPPPIRIKKDSNWRW